MWNFSSLMSNWFYRRYLPHFIGVLSTLVMVVLHTWITSLLSESRRDEITAELHLQLANSRARLEQHLNASLFLTQGLAALITANQQMDERQFARIAQAVMEAEPMIRNIGLAPDNIVRYVYPLEGNDSVIGLNYLNHPRQRQLVLDAIANRHTMVEGPLPLVQGGSGIISRKPVFLQRGGEPRYWGFISIVVDADKLFTELQALQPGAVQLAIRGRDGLGADGEVFFGNPEVFAMAPLTMTVTLPHGSWLLAAVPREGWRLALEIPVFIQYGGYLLALLLGGLIYLTLRSYREATLLARHDPLTGLPNRRLFSERLLQCQEESQRYHRRGALLLLDLDQFKPVNDSHGHHLGDLVLKEVSMRLIRVLRRSDTVSRIGGDEFLVMLPQVSSTRAPKIVAEKLIQSLCQPIEVNGMEIRIGVSIGITLFPLAGLDQAQLIAQADVAMYQAKLNGGNGYAIA